MGWLTCVMFVGAGQAAFSSLSLSTTAILSLMPVIIKGAMRAAAALASLAAFSEAQNTAISAWDHLFFI